MRKWIDKNTKWIFTIPTVAFVVICMAYPLGYASYMSVHEWRMSVLKDPEFVGLRNFIELLTSDRVLNSIKFTFSYFFVCVVLECILGVCIALMLNKIRRFSGVIRTAFLFPMVATPMAMGYVWRMMYDPAIGLFNSILRALNLPTSTFLTGTDTVFTSLVVMEVWHGTPLFILVILAGLSSISTDYYESARIDGANAVQVFFKITLPQLTPTIAMGFMLRGIEVLKLYDYILATTAGGPQRATENLNLLVYTYAFDYLDMGMACALMLIFFLLVLVFALFCIWARRRLEEMVE